MSADRELLELAAKAAGIAHNQWDLEAMRHLGHIVTQGMMWNPLTDDGDALRLAVRLGLSVTVFDDAVGIGSRRRPPGQRYEEFPIEGEPYAVTRRAIVRAAAEIGRSMP